jgi:hypothetical protein
MKFIQKTALAALVCALAAPAAQAATASLTVDSSNISVTDYSADHNVAWSFTGLAGGSNTLSASASPFSGALSLAKTGISLINFQGLADHLYVITLPYSYTVSALNAGDAGAGVTLSLDTTVGEISYSDSLPDVNQTGTHTGSLSLFYVAGLSGKQDVAVTGYAFAAAAPVPEAGTTALTLAGLAVVGGVVSRRRKAQQA